MYTRTMNHHDLDAVASIHKLAYPQNHFSSRFSHDMLIGFYMTLMGMNPASFVACSEEGDVAGFVIGGTNTNKAVSMFIRANRFKLLRVLMMNPSFILSRVINYFKMFFNNMKHCSAVPVRLLSIAVNPELDLQGVGKALLIEFETSLIKNRISQYGLSVEKKNLRAIRFYQRNGFTTEKETENGLYLIKNLHLQ
jgi:ribosomal protein S18 acetylase RimI-like enzyme